MFAHLAVQKKFTHFCLKKGSQFSLALRCHGMVLSVFLEGNVRDFFAFTETVNLSQFEPGK